MKNYIKNNNNNKNSKLMSNCITNNHLKLKYNSISQIINQKKPYGQKRVSKLKKKPLSSNGRN